MANLAQDGCLPRLSPSIRTDPASETTSTCGRYGRLQSVAASLRQRPRRPRRQHLGPRRHGRGPAAAACQRRRARRGRARVGHAVSGCQLVVAPRRSGDEEEGWPDFLVMSTELTKSPTLPTYDSYDDYPPETPVDLTIAQPPDADGNPYNVPTWGENTPPA
ncbi:unnamed protein product [Prorocentrum cordatum]|uniref:Ribulose-bisphosphate carboxylase n=1 Tax=Prorocentrum cordatum TaxID=2364126 RepID=A0ABN9W4M0_9DINO|nr:unnamed protein product [Polarella glacialis]